MTYKITKESYKGSDLEEGMYVCSAKDNLIHHITESQYLCPGKLCCVPIRFHNEMFSYSRIPEDLHDRDEEDYEKEIVVADSSYFPVQDEKWKEIKEKWKQNEEKLKNSSKFSEPLTLSEIRKMYNITEPIKVYHCSGKFAYIDFLPDHPAVSYDSATITYPNLPAWKIDSSEPEWNRLTFQVFHESQRFKYSELARDMQAFHGCENTTNTTQKGEKKMATTKNTKNSLMIAAKDGAQRAVVHEASEVILDLSKQLTTGVPAAQALYDDPQTRELIKVVMATMVMAVNEANPALMNQSEKVNDVCQMVVSNSTQKLLEPHLGKVRTLGATLLELSKQIPTEEE